MFLCEIVLAIVQLCTLFLTELVFGVSSFINTHAIPVAAFSYSPTSPFLFVFGFLEVLPFALFLSMSIKVIVVDML